MSQYPVNTTEGLYDAVNYLLAGPDGIGQNFAGFSAYVPAYVTGTYRQPFSINTTATSVAPTFYVAPINVTNAFPLNVTTSTQATNYIQINFTPQSTPPFFVGDQVTVTGIIDNPLTGNYNGDYGTGGNEGIVSCTTSTMVLQTTNPYIYGTYVSSGTLSKSLINQNISTDCNARVTVTGATDRVFISAQLRLDNINWQSFGISDADVVVAINRYKTSTNAPPTAQGTDFSFVFDELVSKRSINIAAGNAGIFNGIGGEFIFTTVLDQPKIGYYWYILELSFNPTSGTPSPQILHYTTSVRSLTAQVIKA